MSAEIGLPALPALALPRMPLGSPGRHRLRREIYRVFTQRHFFVLRASESGCNFAVLRPLGLFLEGSHV